MFKNFLMKKVLEKKMKDVPPAEREKILGLIEKNPELFQTIAKETQAEIKKGKDQMTAMMEVAARHKDELQKALGDTR